jgi:hypothetical protein
MAISLTDLAAPGVDHKDGELLIADLVTGYGSLRPVLDLDRASEAENHIASLGTKSHLIYANALLCRR